MSLFSVDAKLKVLILWGGRKQRPAAQALQRALQDSVDHGIEVKIILDGHAANRFNDMSKKAIGEADCFLMAAAEDDWEAASSARREWEWFLELTRRGVKGESQWRWVSVAGAKVPDYPAVGDRVFSIGASGPTESQRATIEGFVAVELDIKAGLPRHPPLTEASLAWPSGLVASTLWLILLDDTDWTVETGGRDFKIRAGALTGGLQYLKALHSIHAGLGAAITDPLTRMTGARPQIRGKDPATVREELRKTLGRADEGRLEASLQDCIEHGLLPAFRAYGRRLERTADAEHERRVISATIERFTAILSNDDGLQHVDAGQPGGWWLAGYNKLVYRIRNDNKGLLLSGPALDLIKPGPYDLRRAQLQETFSHAKELHNATVQFGLVVLALFSFLHVQQPVEVEGLEIGDVGHILDEVRTNWSASPVTDRVINWSNRLIRDHLAALEEYEILTHAAI